MHIIVRKKTERQQDRFIRRLRHYVSKRPLKATDLPA